LHSCEVMLKDIEDSKRVNNAVHSELARKSGRQVRMSFVGPGVTMCVQHASACGKC
jgi:hypothetical protein